MTGDGERLGIVSPTGGELEFVELAPRRTFFGIALPTWLPDGEWVLLTCFHPMHLCAVSTSTGEWRHLVVDGEPLTEEALAEADGAALLAGSDGHYIESGHLIYSAPHDNVLMGIRFDPVRLQVSGEPVALLRDVRRENIYGSLQFAVASSGDAVFAPGANAVMSRFVWADGNNVDPLPFGRRAYGRYVLSGDGRRIAAKVYPRVGRAELWFLDLETQDERRWVDEGLIGDRALTFSSWMPGTTEVIVNAEGGTSSVLAVDAVRASGGTELWSGSGLLRVGSIGSDDRLLVGTRQPSTGTEYFSLIQAAELSSLPSDPARVLSPLVASLGKQITELSHFSHDMKWLAYTSDESGPFELRTVRLPPDGQVFNVSPGGGETPRWSHDGLYYRDGRRFYWVALTGSNDRPFAEPELVLEGDFLNVFGPNYDVSPDGSRLLLLQGSGDPTKSALNLVINWVSELEKRIPGTGY